jgi:hypothetical protein
MTSARDDLSWVPRYPAPLTFSDIPDPMRDNPLVVTMRSLSLAEEAVMEALARSDEANDPETIAMVLAHAR